MENTIGINTSHINSAEESLKILAKMLKPYKKMSDSMSLNISAIMKSYSALPHIKVDDFTESLRKTMNMYGKMNFSSLASGLLTDSMSATLRDMGKTFKLYEQTHAFESISALSESMRLLSGSIASEQLEQLCKIDYSSLFSNIVPHSSSLSHILDTAYSMVQEEVSEDNEQNENFTEEEIQETLQEQVSNPEGFQERVAFWTEKKKIQFFIIWQLMCFVYGNFLQPYFQQNIGVPVTAYVVSQVKELPQKGADIICQLKKNAEAIITEDTSYYYRVSFRDENGEQREGYVAKRNLKKIEEEIQKE